MREFDLGSDADLVYILPDAAREDSGWWNQAVARMVEIISSYTREGKIFSVDARLRPGGRDGELIQTETSFRDYFAGPAEAWEALAYLKARTVAGDPEAAKPILQEIQQIGWRRYGLSGDSPEMLDGMRRKLERELGAANPLKAGPGGYYDIDFLLLYLRLRGSMIFYDYLSTPARIDLVRDNGQISAEQAEFLHHAAVFYRGLDHAIRTVFGEASPTIPAAPADQANLASLMIRWGALRPTAQPLGALVDETRRRTRALYAEFFGRV